MQLYLRKFCFQTGLYAIGTALVVLLVCRELGMRIINEVTFMQICWNKFCLHTGLYALGSSRVALFVSLKLDMQIISSFGQKGQRSSQKSSKYI